MNLVVDCGRGIVQRLLQVGFFQEWVLSENILALTVGGQNLQHTPDCNPHSLNAGFAAALAGFHGNAIETWDVGHRVYLTEVDGRAVVSAIPIRA